MNLRLLLQAACFLFVAAMLSGCATPVLQTNNDRYQRVGVVSLVGSEMHAKHVGMTAFGNRSWTGDTGSLVITDYIRDEIVSALRETGVEAEAIAVDASEWYARIPRPGAFSLRGLTSAYGGDIITPAFREDLRQIAETRNYDAIILFVPGRDTTNQTGEAWIGVGDTGFGLMNQGREGVRGYILGHLYLVDGEDVAKKSDVRVQAWSDPLPFSFPPSYEDFSESDRFVMEEAVRAPFAREVRNALPRL